MKDETQFLRPAELMHIAAFCKFALTILNARLLTATALVSATALFGYALWQPDYLRLAGACAYAMLVLWPAQRLDMKRIPEQGEGNE